MSHDQRHKKREVTEDGPIKPTDQELKDLKDSEKELEKVTVQDGPINFTYTKSDAEDMAGGEDSEDS